jgi:hypothetical protein
MSTQAVSAWASFANKNLKVSVALSAQALFRGEQYDYWALVC